MDKSLAFVHYTLELIDASTDGLNEEKTLLIKEKLKNLFIHEIDPSFGFSESEKKEVNNVHSVPYNTPSNINDISDLETPMMWSDESDLIRC